MRRGEVERVMSDQGPQIGTPFQRHLGLRWKLVDDTPTMTVSMEIRDDLRGPAGSLEGGIISTLVDVAGASAIASKVGMVATQHIALSFLAPGRIGPIEATAVGQRVGRSDGVAEVKVVDRGMEDRLMAVALVTVKVLSDR